MPHPIRTLAVAAMAGALLTTPVLAAEHDRAGDDLPAAHNVKLTVRLGMLVDGERTDVKSYDLVLVSGGMSSSLLSGARMAFPRTEGGAEGVGEYVYQNVGFTTEAHAWVLGDGRIKVVATIEDSRVADSVAGNPPAVETRQLRVSAIVEPGVPMEVTRVEGIRDQSGFVEIEATVLD